MGVREYLGCLAANSVGWGEPYGAKEGAGDTVSAGEAGACWATKGAGFTTTGEWYGWWW